MHVSTEREWEYAARGPDALVYPWGNDWIPANVVWSGNSNNQTLPVGSRLAGATWVGALDMSGNVWEWTSSLYLSYPYGEDHENDSDTNSIRVVRGGSWDEIRNLRSAYRSHYVPDYRNNNLGFRCIRNLK